MSALHGWSDFEVAHYAGLGDPDAMAELARRGDDVRDTIEELETSPNVYTAGDMVKAERRSYEEGQNWEHDCWHEELNNALNTCEDFDSLVQYIEGLML